jgi:hypothetical protein
VSIHVVVVRGPFHYDDASSVIRIVEIWIIIAIPHEVAVPTKIGISESKPQSIIGPIKRIAISKAHGIVGTYGCGTIVGIIGIIIVEIRPAGFVLGLHADIVIAGRRAVIFSIGARAGISGAVISGIFIGCGGDCVTGSGGIIDIVWCLCRLPGRRAAAHQDKTNGQEGKYVFDPEIMSF